MFKGNRAGIAKLGLFVAVLVISTSCFAKNTPPPKIENLDTALTYYGFTTPQQKQALRYLMQSAGIANVDQLMDKHLQNSDELLQQIITLVSQTQQHFTVRTGTQERWDVKTADWMRDPAQQSKILQALNTLEMNQTVAPKFKKNDVIAVLGSSKGIMAIRLGYAADLYNTKKLNAKWLVFLVGERYVTSNKDGISIDGTVEELTVLSTKLNKDISKLTETDLMQQVYANSQLYKKLPTIFIDTPKRELPRPTTETTVSEFIMWLQQHSEVNTVTFVSNQPSIKYQAAIIGEVFKQHNVQIKYQVVGPELTVSPVKDTGDKINYLVQTLGSQIWAATPGVLDQLQVNVTDPKLAQSLLDLYKQQPLVYSNLQNSKVAEVL